MSLHPLLQRIGLQYPIFLSPMAGVTTPQLAAEVSLSGGLGALGLGAATPALARQQIIELQRLLPNGEPFQVNFFCHDDNDNDSSTSTCNNNGNNNNNTLHHQQNSTWIEYLAPHFKKYNIDPPTDLQCIYQSFTQNNAMLDIILETRPPIVSFHFGIPTSEQITALKAANIILTATATSLPEALAIQSAGFDIVIAQGIEAGGHRGVFNPKHPDPCINTLDLVNLLTQHLKIPIIAAGGVMNGIGINTMLQSGAIAVQMGTAFISCPSSAASQTYRELLLQQNSVTQITSSISGRPARGLVGVWQMQIDQINRPQPAPYPYAYDLAKQLHAGAVKVCNDQQYGAYWAGTGVQRIRKMEACELIRVLVEEMSMTNQTQQNNTNTINIDNE